MIEDYEGYAVLIFKNVKDLYEKLHQIKLMPEIEKVEASFTVPINMTVPPKSPSGLKNLVPTIKTLKTKNRSGYDTKH